MNVSVVIRCRNEAAALGEVLAALAAQRGPVTHEVIVVDNASTDDTAHVARAAGARVLSIGKGEFSYGRALNLGFEHARGEVVLSLSAHALPVGSRFIELVAEPFARHERLAAVRMLGLGGVDQVRAWARPRVLTAADKPELERTDAWLRAYPAATCAAWSRAAWLEQRFDEVAEANEDKLWASAMLDRGWRLLSCGEATFLYIRDMTWQEKVARERKQHLSLYRIGKRQPLSLADVVGAVPRIAAEAAEAGATHAAAALRRKLDLYALPRLARKGPVQGSHAEFEHKPKEGD